MSDTEDKPPPSRGVVRLPRSATPVTDADEEVFLLYTSLAARKAADGSTGFRGLGHIDSHEDTLTLTFNLGAPARRDGVDGDPVGREHPARSSHRRKARPKRNQAERTLEVEIVQDKTALRSRKGDTGSVLWHASVDLAEALLRQLHTGESGSLLIPDILANAHIVELGAGTGLLAVVLAPFARHYTVSDIEDLVPLIRKNVARNLSSSPVPSPKPKGPISPTQSNITVTPLNWIELRNASTTLKDKLVPAEPADLLLVVDCIYHPSLIPPLLSTIQYLTVPGHTSVLIVVELRAEDVVREFLQGWLELSPAGEWEIWSIGGLMQGPYAMWVGWRNVVDR
ncbi:putative methyltransferase-domain-containing protein [Trametes elegans]|nr:putative methyltransferase-domain-containing protein [Trametes elegans]